MESLWKRYKFSVMFTSKRKSYQRFLENCCRNGWTDKKSWISLESIKVVVGYHWKFHAMGCVCVYIYKGLRTSRRQASQWRIVRSWPGPSRAEIGLWWHREPLPRPSNCISSSRSYTHTHTAYSSNLVQSSALVYTRPPERISQTGLIIPGIALIQERTAAVKKIHHTAHTQKNVSLFSRELTGVRAK